MKRGNRRRKSSSWQHQPGLAQTRVGSTNRLMGSGQRLVGSGRRRLSAMVSALRLPQLYVPTRWVNTLIGLFLLPVAGLLTQTFFHCFSHEAVANRFWATEEFWFFGLGFLLWLIFFFGLPRPVVVYVFGHELTHAIWVWLMGGRVSEFKVGREGGHIITNKSNVFIALAPYFYPIYSMLLLVIYGVASLFTDVSPYHRLFLVFLGGTWSFHVSFTLWMIPKGQSDLTYHGSFYSLVIIYIMNLLVLSVMLIVASPTSSFPGFGQQLLANTENFSTWAWFHLGRLLAKPL